MILVLAGTGESRQIIKELKRLSFKVIASVVTDHGHDLLKEFGIEVHQQMLNQEMMLELIEEKKIEIIIDATHPFAKNVSVNALFAAEKAGINYLRFEREGIEDQRAIDKHGLIFAADFQEAAKLAAKYPRILLTIGSKNLHHFTEEITDWQHRLIIRILSDWQFVKRARELGFSPANIIAMQGPFSQELNKIILKDYAIDVIVCKDSGPAGGLNSRLKAAEELGIPLILIKRPIIDYRRVVNSLEEILDEIILLTGGERSEERNINLNEEWDYSG